jgi:hypothetical protein
MSRILVTLHFQQHIGMASTTFPAAKLLGVQRMDLAIQAMTRSANISRLASQNNVSRKFVYQQKNLALEAINDAFAPAAEDESAHCEHTQAGGCADCAKALGAWAALAGAARCEAVTWSMSRVLCVGNCVSTSLR